MAACVLFFWASNATRGPVSDGKLYLAQGGLVSQPTDQTYQLYLNSGTQAVHVLRSKDLSGVLQPGAARAVLECDAGETEGQTLRLKLSLDLDGDDEYDLVQESEDFRFDQMPGYETVSCDFPPLSNEFSGREIHGKARLELVGDSLHEKGLAVQFHPQRSHLTLPLGKERVI